MSSTDLSQWHQRTASTIRRRSPVSKKFGESPVQTKNNDNIRNTAPHVIRILLSPETEAPRVTPSSQLESNNPTKRAVSPASWQRNADEVRQASRVPSGAHSGSDPYARRAFTPQPQEMKSNIRRFWQASVAEEERIKREEARSSKPKPYSFPRWRSTDALSASLVASNSVELPKDSKIPEQRLQKMWETERLAEIHRAQIHEEVERPRSLRKGKSLDSLIVQLDHQPWYDRDKIRSSVYKESIGNVAEARERFESQTDLTQSRKAHRYQHRDPARPSVPEVEHVGRVTPSQITVYPGCSQGSSQPYYGAENGNHDHHIYSNGHTHSKRSPGVLDHFSAEEQLFMLFMKQNPEMLLKLGVSCNTSTLEAMEVLPWRAVELRFSDEDSTSFSTSPRQGRYLKKGQSASSSPIYSKVRKHEPRDGHGDDHMQPLIERRVSSLIESEIKQLRRREDELHESRRELGLPSLEELMESWKQGPRSYRSDSNQRSTPVQRPSQLSSPNGSWNH
ncbi:hypothetical protein Q1695_011185 [Nippostrongylus brasiliensis]|nr:hypothetical protein Q1695_011185 [Nippostrongylus brasiliensis]